MGKAACPNEETYLLSLSSDLRGVISSGWRPFLRHGRVTSLSADYSTGRLLYCSYDTVIDEQASKSWINHFQVCQQTTLLKTSLVASRQLVVWLRCPSLKRFNLPPSLCTMRHERSMQCFFRQNLAEEVDRGHSGTLSSQSAFSGIVFNRGRISTMVTAGSCQAQQKAFKIRRMALI